MNKIEETLIFSINGEFYDTTETLWYKKLLSDSTVREDPDVFEQRSLLDMDFGVTLVGLLAGLCLGSAYAEEGYAKEVPSVAFKEGSVPSPTPSPSTTPVSLPEGTPSAAAPANPSPAPLTSLTPLAPLATPEWPIPFSLLDAYPAAPVDVAGRYLGAYPGPSHYGGLFGVRPSSAVFQDYDSRWYGPEATPVVLPDGTLANTPHVAAARAQHLAALNRAKALWFGKYNNGLYNPLLRSGYHAYPNYAHASTGYAHAAPGYAHAAPGYAYGPSALAPSAHAHGPSAPWTGPWASPTVLPSGYLADTPDTAAARVAHLAALSRSYEEAALWRSKGLAKRWK